MVLESFVKPSKAAWFGKMIQEPGPEFGTMLKVPCNVCSLHLIIVYITFEVQCLHRLKLEIIK